MASELNIFERAIDVIKTANPVKKADLALDVASEWTNGQCNIAPPSLSPPETPSRESKPELKPPSDMPRRRMGSLGGRQALLHAIAHIELNAIDLAFDMVARFGPTVPSPHQEKFISDWVSVGEDEARHFHMISKRLNELDISYGDLPAHNGLWEAATNTNDTVLARLAIAPMVLEARGLDVTPQMIKNLRKVNDNDSADVLEVIYREEIGHVAIGAHWLKTFCDAEGSNPVETFQKLVKERFAGALKPPFNHEAREKAGLGQEFYANITQIIN